MISKKLSALFVICISIMFLYSGTAFSRQKEKGIFWDSTNGHNHDGSTKGASLFGLGLADGIATLNSSGKLPDGQLPALATVSVFSAANESEQLSPDTESGDVCIRTDESKTYFNNGGTSGTMADWTESIASTPSHASTTGQTTDDHHAKSHLHDGIDGSGTMDSEDVAYDNSGASLSATDVENALDELSDEKIDATEKGAANGVATLDATAKIPSSQIPAVALTDTYTCANESCQTSLFAEEGDVCIRSDETKSYVHNGGTASTMADWWQLVSPGTVISVNGQTGVVTGMEETVNRQTTITDLDTKYPTSGAVVDYVVANPSAHSATTGQTTDDHHAKSHLHDGIDGSGTVASSDVTYDNGVSGLTATDVKAAIDEVAGSTIAHSATTGQTADDHHSSTSDTLDITPATVVTTGNIADGGQFILSGDISPAQITVNQNDYNPSGLSGASTLRLSTDASRNVTGLQDGDDGRILIIHNVGSNDIVLKDEDASSTAANRFALVSDSTMVADSIAVLQYDSTSSRWRIISSGAAGGAVTHASTTGQTVSDHHDWLSNTYNITPATVTATGDIKINSDATNSELLFGTAGDVELFRFAANVLATTDYFIQNGALTTSNAFGTLVGAEANTRYVMTSDGKMAWGPGSATRDTTLYRDAGSVLRTDDSLYVDINLVVDNDGAAAGTNRLYFGSALDTSLYRRASNSLQTPGSLYVDAGLVINNSGGSNKLFFSNAVDVNLYKSAANTLKTDDAFVSASMTTSTIITTGDIKINSNATTSELLFGTAGDVNLYRQDSTTLRTNDNLVVTNALFVDYTTSGYKLWFGPSGDANLYRDSAGFVRTDNSIIVDNALYVDYDNAGYKLLFGSGGDTNLYRSSANVLRTDDSFVADIIQDINLVGGGDVYSNAAGTFYNVSDERLKDVHSFYTKGLSSLEKVKPITFSFNEESGMQSGEKHVGFSAQNVREAGFKEATGINGKGYYTFDSRPLLAAAINAINQLNVKIAALETRIQTLEGN